MEAATAAGPQQEPGSDELERRDDRGRVRPPESVERAANGDRLDVRDETSAIAFLLGPRKRLTERVPVTIETDDGPAKMTFLVRQMDGKRIDAIEEQHRSSQTGVVDMVSAGVQITAEALVKVVDSTGREIEPRSEEFRTVQRGDGEEPTLLADPTMALSYRFAFQLGVLVGVARQVRNISGWSPDRVGTAERVLVEAAGNS